MMHRVLAPRKTTLLQHSLLILLVLGTVLGCANKDIYNDIQRQEIRTCEREPNDGAREHCLQGLGTSHRDYERERQAPTSRPH